MSRLIHVDVLSILFGLGTWLCVNGLWVELPLLVQRLPEAWNLPSYLSVVIQMSNIGPILYTLLNSCFPKCVTEKRSIYFVLIIGLVTTILLANLWDRTSYIGSSEHSTALIVLVFFLSTVDCSSRVLYLPYMAKFQEIYLISYFIGEGLSGFVPSIAALIQGVGGNPECRNNTSTNETETYYPDPRFPINIFFYFLFVCSLISAIAFYLMNKQSIVEKALIPNPRQSSSSSGSGSRSKSIASFQGMYGDVSVFETPRTDNNSRPDCNNGEIANNNDSSCLSQGSLWVEMGGRSFIYLIVTQIIICFLSNGMFPAIQSYSCLPYGNRAYHLAVTLSNMANPTVCFLAFFISTPSKRTVTIISALSIVVSAYVFTTAVMSPSPPLVGKASGEALLVISWILLIGLCTFVRVTVATILRTAMGKRGLFWCGVVTQLGSTLGALVAFFMVNYSSIFVPYYPCS